MVDIEQHRLRRALPNRTDAVQARVEHDQKVSPAVLARRLDDLIHARQESKGRRNVIIDAHRRLPALSPQILHEAQRGTNGVSIGIHMGSDKDFMSCQQLFSCFFQ